MIMWLCCNFCGVYLSRTRALQFLCSGSTRAPSPGFPYFMVNTAVLTAEGNAPV